MKFWQKILGALAFYALLTLIVFLPRFYDMKSHYSVSGLDTDSAIWSYERDFSQFGTVPNKNVDSYWSFPLGYKRSELPYTYGLGTNTIHNLYEKNKNYENFMVLVNLNTILPYFLSCFFGFLLLSLLTKRYYLALGGGALIGFSYYQLNFASGSLANSHFWVIPAFFWLVSNFCINLKNRKNYVFWAIFASLFAGIMFWINFYYGFYTLLFSPFFVFHFLGKDFKKNIFGLVIFYGLVILGVVAININYFINNIAFANPNAKAMAATGRVAASFSPLQEMLSSPTAFFVETRGKDVEFNPWHAFSLGYVLLFPFIIGLFYKDFFRKNYLWYIGTLLALALFSYTPLTYFLNKIYFSIFGVFKGVLRFSLIANIFGVIIFVKLCEYLLIHQKTFQNIFGSKNIGKYKVSDFYRYFYLIFFVLIFVQIFRNIPFQQQLWSHRTDFSSLVDIYKIFDDQRVKSVALFPNYLENQLIDGVGGIPNTYLLGQAIFHKPLAGAVDIKSNLKQSQKYFAEISDIKNSNLIDRKYTILTDLTSGMVYHSGQDLVANLKKYKINTIGIYNRLIDQQKDSLGIDAKTLNQKLQADKRLQYLGRFSTGYDDWSYPTQKDMTADISVYLIKDLVVPAVGEVEFSQPANISYLEYKGNLKIISVENIKNSGTLTLNLPKDSYVANVIKYNQNYDEKSWLDIDDKKNYLNKFDIFNGYFNYRNFDLIKVENLGNEYFSKNSDGSYNIKLAIYDPSYKKFVFGDWLSQGYILVSLILLVLIGMFGTRKKLIKN